MSVPSRGRAEQPTIKVDYVIVGGGSARCGLAKRLSEDGKRSVPSGGWRMGPRVIGVESLRLVDASTMPDMIGGNIDTPVMMVAEKASGPIEGRAPTLD